jgi:hypothetical protein
MLSPAYPDLIVLKNISKTLNNMRNDPYLMAALYE